MHSPPPMKTQFRNFVWMCEEILSLEKRSEWAHAKQNVISEKTALCCGFVKDRTNAVIRKALSKCCKSMDNRGRKNAACKQ